MISCGPNRHFVCFVPNAAEHKYAVLHVMLHKVRENDQDRLVPVEMGIYPHATTVIGQIKVELSRPLRLVDLSAHLSGTVPSIEIVKGCHTFNLLSVELPKNFLLTEKKPGSLGSSRIEVVVQPGTTFGAALNGLVNCFINHEAYWAEHDAAHLQPKQELQPTR